MKEEFFKEYGTNNHIMLDLETLSTENKAVIVQISLVRFNPLTKRIISSLDTKIDFSDQIIKGRHISRSTLLFWLSQEKSAINSVFLDKVTDSTYDALEAVKKFIRGNDNIWGNGPSFDCSKLGSLFLDFGMHIPWKYNNERCVRTVSSMHRSNKTSYPFEGIPHNGIDDCKNQIKYVCETLIEIYNKL
jgi:hypothetical protein